MVACDLCGVAEDDRQKIVWDKLTRARTLHAIYPKEGVMERIWEFLRDDDSAEQSPHSTTGTRPSEGAKG